LFSTIIAQNASKLNKALVDSGLALQVGLNYLTAKYTGPIQLFVVPNPSKIKECVTELKKQLAILDADGYFTDEQLALPNANWKLTEQKSRKLLQLCAHSFFWWCSATLDYYANYLDKVKKLTRGDLQKICAQVYKDKPYVAGLLINSGMVAKVKPAEFFKAE